MVSDPLMKSSSLASVPTPTENPSTGRDGFIWPSPPYASYRDDEGAIQAWPCEVEGANGQSRLKQKPPHDRVRRPLPSRFWRSPQ